MQHPVQAVLAVVLPLLVFAGGASAVMNFEGHRSLSAERELDNAGRVLNGRRLELDTASTMEADLARHRPEVIVLGNSYANANLDTKLVAEALGLPPRKVRMLSVPNSIGPHWYAILKNRVYANGHRPRIVILVAGLQSMLLTDPYSEASYTNLWVQLEPEEPVLDRVVPRSSAWLHQLQARRGMIRDAALVTVRDAAISLVYPSEFARQETDAAMNRVFHASNIDMDRYTHAMPVREYYDRVSVGSPEDVPSPEDSMLRAIGELAADHGTQLIFVRSPMAPRTPPIEEDTVLPGVELATWELITATGHTYVDLSTLPVPDALFENPGHMTEEGARHFTRVLTSLVFEPDTAGAVDLLGGLRLDRGQLVLPDPGGQFAAPPPQVPRADRPVTKNRRNPAMGLMEVRDLHAVSDAATLPISPMRSRCSPIRVLEDGVPLPAHHESCKERFRNGPQGRVCHGPNDQLVFTTSDLQTIPSHAYTLALDPDRACLASRWLYPGDRLVLPVPARSGPVSQLVVAAVAAGERGAVSARLRVAGETRVVEVQPTGGKHATEFVLTLDPPLLPDEPAEVVLENPDDEFALVTRAELLP